MTEREKLEAAGESLGLTLRDRTSDGCPYSWDRADGLILWRLANGDIQTGWIKNGLFCGHRRFTGNTYVEALTKAAARSDDQ